LTKLITVEEIAAMPLAKPIACSVALECRDFFLEHLYGRIQAAAVDRTHLETLEGRLHLLECGKDEQ
jgi:hypothetical protein